MDVPRRWFVKTSINEILASCEEIPAHNKLAITSGSWHNPFHWNLNQVPTGFMKVSIPATLDISIMAGQKGIAS
jgi:hypothetical protein